MEIGEDGLSRNPMFNDKMAKEEATFSKATNRDSTPSIWEETKA